eukprot:7099494-Pyramimonas_sp.AAC.1
MRCRRRIVTGPAPLSLWGTSTRPADHRNASASPRRSIRFFFDINNRQQPSFWKALFDSVLEVEAELPARFNQADCAASSIDR